MTDDKNKECPLLRDTAFVDLMKRRIFNVLLIANPYDAFMLEDDGRVEEKIGFALSSPFFPSRFAGRGGRRVGQDHFRFDYLYARNGQ